MTPALHIAVLAAGEGTRLGAARPKVLTPLWGRPSVAWPLAAAAPLEPQSQVVVVGRHRAAIEAALTGAAAEADGLRPVAFADQAEPLGTGHALLCARDALAGATGRLLVLYGDCPLVHPALLEELLATHDAAPGALTLLTTELDDPTGYGRVLRDDKGRVQRIVEQADASDDEQLVCEVNTGIWVLDLPDGLARLEQLGRDNAQGEVYLTDLVGLAAQAGEPVATLCCPDPEDVLGFNDHAELALVRGILRERILGDHLEAGVEIVDPTTTFLDVTVRIEAGAQILPCTMIEGHVSIAAGCAVGPFAHLRDGTVLEAGAEVGNFTETKKARLGPGSKAKHLTYLGNAEIGAKVNVGCGTITANYDGKHKHTTTVRDGAFLGSGTVLVAPSEVGAGARTGAGAIVTANSKLDDGATWVGVPARPLRARRDATDPGQKEPSA